VQHGQRRRKCWGTVLVRTGFASLDQAVSIGQKLVVRNPTTIDFTSGLAYSHAHRRWARVRAVQPDLAAADLRKAIELWTKDPAPSIGKRFEKVRALALVAKLGADAKSGVTADEGKVFADQAVAAPADAIKAGSSELKELKEADFDAVRSRDDFKKLLADQEAKTPKPAEVAPPSEKR
jgi:hypothetical protein